MAMMVGAIEAPAAVNGARRRPRLLCVGRFRKLVVKLNKACEQMVARDEKENQRAAGFEYEPYLFVGSIDSRIHKALQTIMNNCNDTLADRG